LLVHYPKSGFADAPDARKAVTISNKIIDGFENDNGFKDLESLTRHGKVRWKMGKK